jgi:D-arginine dehydrogenase
VIGYSDRVEGLFWLAGLGGYGIQTSPAYGQIAAALIQGTDIPEPMRTAGLNKALFSPSRFES